MAEEKAVAKREKREVIPQAQGRSVLASMATRYSVNSEKLLDTLKDVATDELQKGPTKDFKRKDVDRSSDQPPPACFASHLQIIEDTAPNATPAVWWEYAKKELTEAEVAIAEAKLARRSDANATKAGG